MTSIENKRSPDPYGSPISLRDLVRPLWAGKWIIAGVTAAATVLAVVVSLTLPNIYRAEALLAPNEQDSPDGLSALASQYSGLASLAGLNINSGSTNKIALGLEVLKSRKFIYEFVERHGALVPLLAIEGWNAQTGELIIDPDQYDTTTKQWVRSVRPPRKVIPSPHEAYTEFMSILSVQLDQDTGLVTVAVEHASPTVAKQWVDWLIADLNLSIMQQDVAKAEQSIEYLNEQIESTSIANLQNVFFNLIEEQKKTVMLANVTDEYFLRTLDPAVVPETKSKPRRSLIVVLSALFGALIASAAVLISASLRQERAAA